MPFIDRGSRVGRSQGASIFWGLISVFFAAAACFYYFKNHENEMTADVMRDQVMQLREENESLHSERDHLQAGKVEAEDQFKTREDLVAQKETGLAQEEAQFEALAQQPQSNSPQNMAQVPIIKRFNDVIRKLDLGSPPDVIERSGRPVLRLPNAELFRPGAATLKPEGKALLNQITVAISGLLPNFELRVVTYTDTNAEADAATGVEDKAGAKPRSSSSWELTAARAATLGHYYRDQTTLPFANVLVIGRGDSEPIASLDGANSARNRRVEITIAPLPIPFHSLDAGLTPMTPEAMAPTSVNPMDNSAATPSLHPKKKKAKPPLASNPATASSNPATDTTTPATPLPAVTPATAPVSSPNQLPARRVDKGSGH